MGVDRYSARRHRLTTMVAQLRASLAMPAKPRARAAAAKTGPSVSAAARNRRLRIAEAECAMSPAPLRKPSPPLAPDACSSMMVGGSLFDRTPVIYAADCGAPASGTTRRVNARPTRRQVAAMLRRVDAAMAAS